MDMQLQKSREDELGRRGRAACGSEKWFWRTMAAILVIMAALAVVIGVQHIWLTQILIAGMAI